MEYKNFNYSNKSQIEELLLSEDLNVIISSIIGMINGVNDRVWVQNKLLELSVNSNFWIAKNAITGIGDLARLYGKLDKKKVDLVISGIKNDQLDPVIKEMYEDINIYLK